MRNSINHEEIKFAGDGNPTEWLGIIGVAIDKYSGNTLIADDNEIKKAIKHELDNSGIHLPPIDTLPKSRIEEIDQILKGSSKNLTSKDLQKLF
ncbi:hypothetical protein PS673_02057 [Pseudomonas fluorescens]|jgi:hypothetical protein|uniref:Uncharacterized protein n=1 Tax=Pseudomonas fluorescens TaxID=294 RepID=A0A5E6S7F9_PSEFL|nr:hypothetical protein [Pseudomonas fluorescens]VVM76637.1 hypothetical protein PS673_02057 [Pseudomonas fluorescens]